MLIKFAHEIRLGGVGKRVFEIAIAVFIVLITAVAFAESGDSGTGKKYKIRGGRAGKIAERHEVELLLDEFGEDAEARMSYDGAVVSDVKGRFKIEAGKVIERTALELIERHRKAFGLKDPKSELDITTEWAGQWAATLMRFQQMYNSIPIEGHGISIEVDKWGVITHISGGTIPTPDMNTTPVLSAAEAIEKVKEDINKRAGGDAGLDKKNEYYPPPPTAELIIKHTSSLFKLAYRVHITLPKLKGDVGAWTYYIDAKDGEIVEKQPEIGRINSAWP